MVVNGGVKANAEFFFHFSTTTCPVTNASSLSDCPDDEPAVAIMKYILLSNLDNLDNIDFDVPSDKFTAMGTLIDQLNRSDYSFYVGVALHLELTPHTAYPTFRDTVRNVFSDNIINWGRIAAVFGFALAVAVLEPVLVNDIPLWFQYVFPDEVTAWISAQGGWNGMLLHYSNLQSSMGSAFASVFFRASMAFYLALAEFFGL